MMLDSITGFFAESLSQHNLKADKFECNSLTSTEIEGKWFTYFSERGSKNDYKEWNSEEEAVEFIAQRAEEFARELGYWKD